MEKGCAVFGIGNPLLDLVCYTDYDFIKKMNTQPGTMNLISEEEKETLLSMLPEYKQVPGGSCANTMRGLAWLSRYDNIGDLVYSGAVGTDKQGKDYTCLMENDFSIRTFISEKKLPSGISITAVTPDFERTMFTYLGACREFGPDGIHFNVLEESKILHFNGYMWDTENQKEALNKAMACAKKNKVMVSFDVADPFAVQRYKEDFLCWVPEKVDILFGNLEECALLTGMENTPKNKEEIIKKTGDICPFTVVKAGADGCYINEKGTIHHQPGKKVDPKDTIGAGDSFAAGFLFGLLKKYSIKETASLANAVAAHIVTVPGCDYTKLNYKEVMRSND